MNKSLSRQDSKTAPRAPPEEQEVLKKSPWIHAWSDPVASLCIYGGAMRLCDTDDDGEHKLVLADSNSRKLKVYKGTNLHFEAQLPDVPSCLEYFYSAPKKPAIPYIAVGCGSAIYIHYKYKAYYKLALPDVQINPQEKDIWKKIHSGELTIPDACKALQVLRNDGSSLAHP
eukprot:TRINITY_DN4241_c0_g2_i2.p2 TRINITY_DN4241_c0_g2~~TRINITY_DN4241_c0_g2_i2.p2  ORF type:complete len:172 (-),score=53.31 TRINITY_DN4241_c0_g2_i2:248-763(-)